MIRKANQRKGKKNNTKFKDETDISSIDDYQETNTFLKKKTKSESLLPTSSSSLHSPAQIGKQCDICLEYDKYTLTKCIKCSVCEAYCHLKCYQEHFEPIAIESPSSFICSRCNECQNEGIDYRSKQCLICNEYSGIVKKIDKRNHYVVHVHCIIFIKELIEEKDGNDNDCNHNHYRNHNKASNIRKWRMKSQCKLCKEEINESTADKAVIKCTNSKCQSYYHIPCANKLKLLYPIDFQYDFYGVTKDKRGLVHIPFYCAHHNKKIVKEYDGFIAQMEFVLKESQFQPDQHQPCSNSFIDFYETNSQLSFNEENALSIDFNPWVNNSKLSLSNETNDLDIDDNRDDISYFEDSLWNLQE